MKRKGEQPQGVATFCCFAFHFSLFFLTISSYISHSREKEERRGRRKEDSKEEGRWSDKLSGPSSYLIICEQYSSVLFCLLFF